MTKSSGLGQFLLVGGVNLSGDVGSLSNVHGGPAALDSTGIDKSAHERIGGVLDGGLDYVAFFNDAVGRAHPTLRTLPTSDVSAMYGTASTIGLSAACMVGKQVAYDPTRAQDGSIVFAVPKLANGYGLEWCDLLTAGLRTDTAATNGATLDGTAASTTGWAAYLQVTAATVVDATITIQDSADGISWAAVTGGAFTAVTAAPAVERIAGAAGATLRRYVRAVSSTTGGITTITFAVAITRHPVGATA